MRGETCWVGVYGARPDPLDEATSNFGSRICGIRGQN